MINTFKKNFLSILLIIGATLIKNSIACSAISGIRDGNILLIIKIKFALYNKIWAAKDNFPKILNENEDF